MADLLGQRLVERVREEEARGKNGKVGPAGPRRPRAAGLHRRRARTGCGWPTSPSTAPVRASSTCARSRTCAPTGSSATPSTHRMKARLAVNALDNAVAARAVSVAGCVAPHRPRIAISLPEIRPRALNRHRHGRVDGPSRRRRRQRRHGILLRACCKTTSSTADPGPPARSCGSRSSPGSNGPTTAADAKTPRPVDPHRVRDHHDHTGQSGRLTQPVTYPCSRPSTSTWNRGFLVRADMSW